MILFSTDHANSKIIQIQLTLFGPSTQYFYYKNPSINPIKIIIESSSLNNMANDNQNNTQATLIQNQLQCLQNIYSLTIDHITNNEIIEFKHSINKISSLTSQHENDTE